MDQLKSIQLSFDYQDKHYSGEAISGSPNKEFLLLPAYDVFLDNEYNGTIVKTSNSWTSDNHFDSALVKIIGSIVSA